MSITTSLDDVPAESFQSVPATASERFVPVYRRRRPSEERSSDPGDRLDFVEGMRGLAALYVVLGHFVSMVDPRFLVGGRSASPPWLRPFLAPFVYGHLAVAAFIVISGFCLQWALFRSGDGHFRGGKRFFRRRALRILPAYYACLLLSILVTATVTPRFAGTLPFDTYLPLTGGTVLTHALLIHNLFTEHMYKLNGVLWSIAVEAQLYLVFPLLVAALWRWGRRATLLGTLVLALVLIGLVPGAGKLYFWFLPLFVGGMAAAHIAFRPQLALGVRPKAAGVLVLALVLTTIVGTLGRLSIVWTDLAFGAAVAAFLYRVVVAPGGVAERVLAWRPLVGLGTFSYSLYLVHHPLQQVLWSLKPNVLVSPRANLAYLLVVALPLIVAFAWAFARLFERPFMARAKRRERSPDARRAALVLPLQTAGNVVVR